MEITSKLYAPWRNTQAGVHCTGLTQVRVAVSCTAAVTSLHEAMRSRSVARQARAVDRHEHMTLRSILPRAGLAARVDA